MSSLSKTENSVKVAIGMADISDSTEVEFFQMVDFIWRLLPLFLMF